MVKKPAPCEPALKNSVIHNRLPQFKPTTAQPLALQTTMQSKNGLKQLTPVSVGFAIACAKASS
jgi:hypothetical protein